MDARALRRGLPDATTRVLAATSRGPLARAAAGVLVAGESVATAQEATRAQVERGRTVSWMPLMKPALAPDDILTAREIALAALVALSESGAEEPDLTLDLRHFGVFADEDTAGLLVVTLREVCQRARNLGVTLTLTIADAACVEVVFILAAELRQDFPEVGLVLPTRLRGVETDLDALAVSGSRVRLSTGRLDPGVGTPSARESGKAFVDVTKRLAGAGVRLGLDCDDVLLLDIAASIVDREKATAEVVVPYGTPEGRIAEYSRAGMKTRILVPYGTHALDHIAQLVAARPSLALSLPNPIRRRRRA